MSGKGYYCSLHKQNLQFFCQRCFQPVCKQCITIGPHHTQIHSITKISVAYEGKVQQIKNRIQEIVEGNRQKIFKIIIQLNNDIENVELIKKSVNVENDKEQQRMVMSLIKQFQNNRNSLQSHRQSLIEKSNQINDIGFKYQTIQNPIQLLGSHQKILQELKEIHDRLQIFLSKALPLNPYTKQLTEMRLKLKQIQAINELYQDKIFILQSILKKTNALPSTVSNPKINYQELLQQLNLNLRQIQHYVCHFCGVQFSSQQINKQCSKNNVNLSLGLNTTSEIYCINNPDTNKLGTHRHFFSVPKNPLSFYKLGRGSFKIQLDGVLLKAKTLSKIKNINIKKQFKENDKGQNKACEKIVFDYIFIEILGMSQKQKDIINTIAKQSQKCSSLFSYEQILQQLQKIDI